MGNLAFSESGWDDYLYWQTEDKKTLKRINQLLQDILRNGYDGIGKPEPLRENLSGYWSRRIDATNRLVYRISGESIYTDANNSLGTIIDDYADIARDWYTKASSGDNAKMLSAAGSCIRNSQRATVTVLYKFMFDVGYLVNVR